MATSYEHKHSSGPKIEDHYTESIVSYFSVLNMIDHYTLTYSDMLKSYELLLLTKLSLVENSFSGLVLVQ